MKNGTKGLHPEDIKAALRKKYGTVNSFLAAHNRAASNFNRVLKAPTSIPLERLISEAIEIPLHVIWPDRWLPDGRAIGRSHRQTNTSDADGTQRQNREAA